MPKLTKTQLEILISADGRDDGRITRPNNLRPVAAAKAASTLTGLGLVRETRAKVDMPVWRQDEQGKTFSLAILKAGRAALQAQKANLAVAENTSEFSAEPIETTTSVERSIPRPTSKIGMIVGLLEKDGGATAKEMVKATDWLPHTLRAALTGLRKRGYTIERIRRDEGAPTAYRIAAA